MQTKNYKGNSNKIGIYSITNLISSKKYIGSTKRSFHSRKTRHLSSLLHGNHFNDHLQFSYNKHGIDNFVFEIIEICALENVEKREAFYIKKFKTNNRLYGYNIAVVKHYKFNHKFSEKIKNNMSLAKQIKAKNDGYTSTERGLNKSVNLYTLQGTFIKQYESSKSLSDFLGVNRSNLCNVLKNRKLKVKNYIVLYSNQELSQEDLDYLNKRLSKTHVNIYDLNDNLIKENILITEAAQFLNCKDAEIRMCYTGKRKRIRKFKVIKIN